VNQRFVENAYLLKKKEFIPKVSYGHYHTRWWYKRKKGYHMPLIDQERNEKLNKIKRKN